MIKSFLKRLLKPISPGPRKTLHARHQGPRRYGHSEHHIDLHRVSANAIRVCEVLQQHHYQAYIVGGAVRDLMLGRTPKDFDVATNATPEQVQALFRRARIIGRRFRLVHVVFGREIIETSTFRALGDASQPTDEHGRVLRDNAFGNQESDARRRDFTVNALYYDPVTQQVIDFHGGVADLQAKRLSMIGDPAHRYREDPVRMLRAVRFAAKLGFEIEQSTAQPLTELAPLLEHVPSARLFDELLKLLCSGQALACLTTLQEFELHRWIFPALDRILKQTSYRAFVADALGRTDSRIAAGKSVSESFVLAALLWPEVAQRWERAGQQRPTAPSQQTLQESIDHTLNSLSGLAIQRRFAADMQEIWMMQPRFERRLPRSLMRMAEQPRFRAACDFLQLRAAHGQFDRDLALWWMRFADAEVGTREDMIEELRRSPAADTDKPRRKRRRRPSNTAPNASQLSSEPSDA